MKQVRLVLLLTLVLLSPLVFSHENHGLPGSLPPPEHEGGKVGDATSKGKAELVLEVWRAGGEVRVEPKNAKSNSEWEKIVVSEVSDVAIEVQPSKGPKRKVPVKTEASYFALEKAGFDIQKPFTLFFSAKYKGEPKTAKIPIGK